jgi:hypothetical protein
MLAAGPRGRRRPPRATRRRAVAGRPLSATRSRLRIRGSPSQHPQLAVGGNPSPPFRAPNFSESGNQVAQIAADFPPGATRRCSGIATDICRTRGVGRACTAHRFCGMPCYHYVQQCLLRGLRGRRWNLRTPPAVAAGTGQPQGTLHMQLRRETAAKASESGWQKTLFVRGLHRFCSDK